MAINLQSLSPAELQALIKNAESQMGSARKSQIQEVRTKVDALLKSSGLTIAEVFPTRGGKRAAGTKSAVAPKYRSPDNATQVWSGRGKRPLWFVAALKKRGVTAESLLIEGAAMAAPAKQGKKAPVKAAKKVAARKASKK
jgi:DNA-binding protein H-NS